MSISVIHTLCFPGLEAESDSLGLGIPLYISESAVLLGTGSDVIRVFLCSFQRLQYCLGTGFDEIGFSINFCEIGFSINFCEMGFSIFFCEIRYSINLCEVGFFTSVRKDLA